jgi:hypothetical protein
MGLEYESPKLHSFAVPPDVLVLYCCAGGGEGGGEAEREGDKWRVPEWVPADPYLGPVMQRRCCRTCQLLPWEPETLFQVMTEKKERVSALLS